MKATRLKLGCVAALCFLFLLPARASARVSLRMRIGSGHLGIHSSRGSDRTWHGGHHGWAGARHNRFGHGYRRSSRLFRPWRRSYRHSRSYGSTVWAKEYPAYREVEIYREPVVRHEVHVGSGCCGTVTRRVETYCR
jgi:hypothetical protein